MSLPGYTALESKEVVDGLTAQLVHLALDAIKSGGKKKVEFEIEVEAKLSDDGKSVKLEIEVECQEDGQEEKRKLEYSVPL